MSKSHEVELENGTTGEVEVCKNYEDGSTYYVGRDEEGDTGGVAYSSEEDAIESLNERSK